MTDKKPAGGCMCGAVRYELQDDSTWNVYCHCESCRKHTGAPVVAFAVCSPNQVHWISSERARYESAPGRFRAFCHDCGTSLTWEAEINNRSFLAIHVSTLDHPEDFPPTEHTFHDESIPWLDTDDDLPRHKGSKYI